MVSGQQRHSVEFPWTVDGGAAGHGEHLPPGVRLGGRTTQAWQDLSDRTIQVRQHSPSGHHRQHRREHALGHREHVGPNRPQQMLVDDHRAIDSEVKVAGPCVARIGRDLSEDPLGGGVRSGPAGLGRTSSFGKRGGSVILADRVGSAYAGVQRPAPVRDGSHPLRHAGRRGH